MEVRQEAVADPLARTTVTADRTTISEGALAQTITENQRNSVAQRDAAQALLQQEFRNIKRLCDLVPPAHASDPRAFFDCVCEVCRISRHNSSMYEAESFPRSPKMAT